MKQPVKPALPDGLSLSSLSSFMDGLSEGTKMILLSMPIVMAGLLNSQYVKADDEVKETPVGIINSAPNGTIEQQISDKLAEIHNIIIKECDAPESIGNNNGMIDTPALLGKTRAELNDEEKKNIGQENDCAKKTEKRELDKKIAQTDAKIAQTDAKIAQTDAKITQTDAKITQTDVEIAKDKEVIAQTDAEITKDKSDTANTRVNTKKLKKISDLLTK